MNNDERVPVLMSSADKAALDSLRKAEEDLPSRSEMVRRLIDRAKEPK